MFITCRIAWWLIHALLNIDFYHFLVTQRVNICALIHIKIHYAIITVLVYITKVHLTTGRSLIHEKNSIWCRFKALLIIAREPILEVRSCKAMICEELDQLVPRGNLVPKLQRKRLRLRSNMKNLLSSTTLKLLLNRQMPKRTGGKAYTEIWLRQNIQEAKIPFCLIDCHG